MGRGHMNRADRKNYWATLVRTLASQQDLTVASMASAAGVSSSRARQWVEPEHKAQMSLSDAAAMPLSFRIKLAEELVGSGHCVVPVEPELASADIRASSHIVSLAAEVARLHLNACAKGTVTQGDMVALSVPLRSLLKQCASMLSLADKVRRERVVQVKFE